VDDIGVALDGKIKAPTSIDPGLPDVALLIVLFGPQGRVTQVLEEKLKLSVKGLLDGERSLAVKPQKLRGKIRPY
jgi:hypothetical protein